VYVDGRLFTRSRVTRLLAEFRQILDNYVESHYAAKESSNKERINAEPLVVLNSRN